MRGSIRRRGSTYTWYVSMSDPVTGERRQRSKGGFRTKRECQEALNEALARLREGTFVRSSPRGLGVFLVDEWLLAVRPPRVRPSTWDSYRMAVERPHCPGARWGGPAEAHTGHLTAFYRSLLDGGDGRGAVGWPPRPCATSTACCMPPSAMRCAGDTCHATSPRGPTYQRA